MFSNNLSPKATEILHQLYRDGKKNLDELANLANISRQTAAKIRKRLWKQGIIRFPAIIVHPKIPEYNSFFIEVKTNPSEPAVLSDLQNFSDLVALDGILGDYSLICRFQTFHNNAKGEIIAYIDSTLSRNSAFQSYRLIDVLDTYKMGGFIIPRDISPEILSKRKMDVLDLFKHNYNPKRWRPEERSQKFMPFSKSSKIDSAEKISNLNYSRESSIFEEKHQILFFSCIINPEYIHRKLKLYLRIQPKSLADYEKLALYLVKRPEITDLFRTGEEYGLMAIVRSENLTLYDKFIQDIYRGGGIKNSHTTVCISEIIPWISPPV